jgi:hypothetical protein
VVYRFGYLAVLRGMQCDEKEISTCAFCRQFVVCFLRSSRQETNIWAGPKVAKPREGVSKHFVRLPPS